MEAQPENRTGSRNSSLNFTETCTRIRKTKTRRSLKNIQATQRGSATKTDRTKKSSLRKRKSIKPSKTSTKTSHQDRTDSQMNSTRNTLTN